MGHLIGYIATGLVSLTVGVLLIYLRPKAKVLYWSPHSFLFDLQREKVVLQTDALTLQNLGRDKAENVEIIFDRRPDFFQFAPAIKYQPIELDNGNFVLSINTLGSKEYVTLQILSYTQVPKILNVKSSVGFASPMPFQIQRLFPRWFNYSLVFLMLIGLGFSLFWVVKAAIFISRNIGVI